MSAQIAHTFRLLFFLLLTLAGMVWGRLTRGMHGEQVVQNERVQSELEAMRRKESSDREGTRELEGRMQRTANELHECLADKMTLEGEKRALEESLRNVLHINDQLLQKVTAPCFPRRFPPFPVCDSLSYTLSNFFSSVRP